MNIINQLEKIVTPAVLGASGNVAHISLLEQFYALLITRLAIPDIYEQLLSDELRSLDIDSIHTTLFEQVWQQPSQRHLLLKELSTTHHIPEIAAEPLLINASHLAYRELNILANGQFLPTFLQQHQAAVRPYLPVWAETVVSPLIAVVTESVGRNDDALIYANSSIPKVAADTERVLQADAVPVIVETPITSVADAYVIEGADALHASPSDYRVPDSNAYSHHAEIRQRNRRNDLIVRLLLAAAALSAAFLVWALLIKPNNEVAPVEPVTVAPVEPTVKVEEPPAQILTPAELMVSVDYSGSLYTCSATVGDIALQDVLKQALYTSFGDQSNICQFTVQEGVATTLTNVNIDTLPNVLMLMRTAPFLRLQIQNDSMSLEAPDEMLLQRLLVDMRTLMPAMTIATNTTLANTQPPANTYDDTYNNDSNSYNNSAIPNNGSAPITTTNNMMTNQPNPSFAATNNSNVDTVPPPPPPQSGLNTNNTPQNNPSGQHQNAMPADIADLADSTIISELAIGGNPASE